MANELHQNHQPEPKFQGVVLMRLQSRPVSLSTDLRSFNIFYTVLELQACGFFVGDAFGLLLLVVPEAVPTPGPCPLGLTDPPGTGEICLAGAGARAFSYFPFALSWQQNMFQCQTLSQALFFKHIASEHEGACTAHLPQVS